MTDAIFSGKRPRFVFVWRRCWRAVAADLCHYVDYSGFRLHSLVPTPRSTARRRLSCCRARKENNGGTGETKKKRCSRCTPALTLPNPRTASLGKIDYGPRNEIQISFRKPIEPAKQPNIPDLYASKHGFTTAVPYDSSNHTGKKTHSGIVEMISPTKCSRHEPILGSERCKHALTSW